jgi:hypothetical protein
MGAMQNVRPYESVMGVQDKDQWKFHPRHHRDQQFPAHGQHYISMIGALGGFKVVVQTPAGNSGYSLAKVT